LPKDLPPKSTAHSYFMLWDWSGTLERIHDSLYVALRESAGKEASPTTAIIDSQSAKAAQKGAQPLIRKGLTQAKSHGAQAPYPGRYARQLRPSRELGKQADGIGPEAARRRRRSRRRIGFVKQADGASPGNGFLAPSPSPQPPPAALATILSNPESSAGDSRCSRLGLAPVR
jgi:hypothetical protein